MSSTPFYCAHYLESLKRPCVALLKADKLCELLGAWCPAHAGQPLSAELLCAAACLILLLFYTLNILVLLNYNLLDLVIVYVFVIYCLAVLFVGGVLSWEALQGWRFSHSHRILLLLWLLVFPTPAIAILLSKQGGHNSSNVPLHDGEPELWQECPCRAELHAAELEDTKQHIEQDTPGLWPCCSECRIIPATRQCIRCKALLCYLDRCLN